MVREQINLIFWCAVSAVAAWAWYTLPSIDHPLGSDWGHYFTAAEFIWEPKDGLAYPDFRKPYFGWVLGGLGQWLGFFPAAQLIGRLSMVVMVFSAALLGWALAGRWAGLVACFVVPLMPLTMDGALWVNHYPLLGAVTGLCVASAAMATRTENWFWPALAGLMGGAAYALDMRGAIALPIGISLVVLGRFCIGWIAMAKGLVPLLAFSGVVLAHDAWLQRAFQVPQLEFEQQLLVQRKGTLEQISQGIFDNRILERACAGQTLRPPSVNDPLSACGKALSANSRQRLSSMRIIPSDRLLWLLPLVLIPAVRLRRIDWKTSLSSLVVFGAPVASLWVGMGWVTYFDRYVLPLAVMLACLVPVALSRVLGLVCRIVPIPLGAGHLIAGIGSFGFVLQVWPGWGARGLDAPELARSSEYHAGVLAKWARNTVEAGDSVTDCAGLALDSLILPSKIDYVRFPPGDPACDARIRSPQATTGTNFLITMHRDIPPQYSADDLAFNPVKIASSGWREVEHGMQVDGFRVWEMR